VTTALDLITRSMRLAGSIGTGETPSDAEADSGLEALNAMLDSWQIQRLYVYQIQTQQFTWTALAQSRTVGAAGNFVTSAVPTQIANDCSFTINSIDYPVQLIDVDAWSNIPDKTTQSSFPWWIYPEYGAALVTLYAYPIPNANITFNLRSWLRLQTFAALTDDLALPPGNERAIAFSLAEEFAGPEFGIEVPASVSRIAASARRALRRINSPSPVMASEAGYLSRRYTASIYGDGP
jgi:hypothetical protein